MTARLVEVLSEVADNHRRGESQRDCIEGLGWVWACWCTCDWHGRDRDHDDHLAAEMARAVAEWLVSPGVMAATEIAIRRGAYDTRRLDQSRNEARTRAAIDAIRGLAGTDTEESK